MSADAPPEIPVAAVVSIGGTTLFLGVIGVIAVAASDFRSGLAVYAAGRQLLALTAALAVMWLAAKIPSSWYFRFAKLLFTMNYGLILLLFLWGTKLNGARNWFRFGNWSFQPAETGKVFFLLLLASAAALPPGRRRFLALTVPFVSVLAPLLLLPDFGTAAIYAAIYGGALLLLGFSPARLATAVLLLAAAALLWVQFNPYAGRRLRDFRSQWHVRQLAAAVRRGGWTGSKTGTPAAAGYTRLPYPGNDSAFAVLCETTGIAGALFFSGLFLLLLRTLYRAAARCRRLPEELFLLLAVLLPAVQGLLHAAVNLALVPATGVTMPFLSYGGSSLMSCGLLLGISLSIIREAGRGNAVPADYQGE